MFHALPYTPTILDNRVNHYSEQTAKVFCKKHDQNTLVFSELSHHSQKFKTDLEFLICVVTIETENRV